LLSHDANSNPAYLDITVQPLNRIFAADMHEAPVRDHIKPTREILTSTNGTVFHHMELDGIANICLKAPRKNLQKGNKEGRVFYRYALRIQTTEEVVPRSASTAKIDDQLSAMEQEMERIQTAMKNILHQADFAKDKDAEMHKQFLAMHSTTFYWPVVQLCVLLITGFTQVRHIVHFFKKRRII
jgi:hypothetical protein